MRATLNQEPDDSVQASLSLGYTSDLSVSGTMIWAPDDWAQTRVIQITAASGASSNAQFSLTWTVTEGGFGLTGPAAVAVTVVEPLALVGLATTASLLIDDTLSLVVTLNRQPKGLVGATFHTPEQLTPDTTVSWTASTWSQQRTLQLTTASTAQSGQTYAVSWTFTVR